MDIFSQVDQELKSKGYTYQRVDFNRPWGGFFVLNELHKVDFISQYFTQEARDSLQVDLPMSPKILIVAPEKRLSWQYHHRRSEVWQVAKGSVGIITSDTDTEQEMKIYNEGQSIILATGQRHRLVGLDNYAIIAEIWVHIDPDHPSDEDDIVRLQDDFGR